MWHKLLDFLGIHPRDIISYLVVVLVVVVVGGLVVQAAGGIVWVREKKGRKEVAATSDPPLPPKPSRHPGNGHQNPPLLPPSPYPVRT